MIWKRPVYSSNREPDVGGDDAEQNMLAQPDRSYPHLLALQVDDAANGFAREQLETARMHTR
jgi:hypothetical protein